MKQIIKSSIFLLLALILPAIANAHDFEVDGIFYIINGNEAVVTYKGSYESEYYNEYSGSVTIPSTVTYGGTTYTVTSIGHCAFYNCSSLTSIDIPNTVTTIGSGAFYNTAWYNNQPDGLVYAGLVAYGYKGTMPSGTSIAFRDGTRGIAGYAFNSCSGLASVTIPSSVSSIGIGAFGKCNELKTLNFDATQCEITLPTQAEYGYEYYFTPEDVPFYNSGISTIIIGENVKSIPYIKSFGIGIFEYCNAITNLTWNSKNCQSMGNMPKTTIEHVTIGNSVEVLPSSFVAESRITEITIPNSVTSIGNEAFNGCSGLTSINIGNSVTRIENYAFSACNNLTNVYCYAVNPPTCFEKTFETYSATLHVPASSLAAYFTAPCWCNFENIIGDAVVPTAITISKDSVNLQLTEQIKLTATVTPANASNKVISWHSTNTDIATVENGNVTAIGIGECDIIATCFGMSDTCHIAVTNTIKLDHQEAMLLPNHILTLTPTAPAEPEGYTVSSSDPTVAAARVMNGKVQVVGIKEGTTTITVNSSDGTAQPATCLVTVYTELGDLNVDGFVTISDVTALIDYLLGGEASPFNSGNADVNGDQTITIKDVTALIDLLLSGSV